MANATRLASVSCVAGGQTTAYFNGTAQAYIVSANVCNIGNQACTFRMALTDEIVASDDSWIEYETEILGHGVLEREGIVISPGQRIIVRSNTSLCSVNVWGIPIGSVVGAVPIVTNGDFTNGLDNWTTTNVSYNNQGFAVLDGRINGSADCTQALALGTGLDYSCTFDCVSFTGTNTSYGTFTAGGNTQLIQITGVGAYTIPTIQASTSLGNITFSLADTQGTPTSVIGIDNVRISPV